MADPIPDRIGEYPEGKIDYLFRKKLYQSDITGPLRLVKGAIPFLENNPEAVVGLMISGLELILYTPKGDHLVTLKRDTFSHIYKLLASGWKIVVWENGFKAGMEIDCWAVTSENDTLSLLIQEVVEEKEDEE